MGLFTRHFVLILRGMREERPYERGLKWESRNLQLGKSLEIYVSVYHSSSSPRLKKEHLDNKSSPYKWMRHPEPFERGLICLVAFKRRNQPELVYVKDLIEVFWHSIKCLTGWWSLYVTFSLFVLYLLPKRKGLPTLSLIFPPCREFQFINSKFCLCVHDVQAK